MTATQSTGSVGNTAYLWRWAGGLTVLYWVLVLLLFGDTALSVEAIWARSDTFAHGYLILPIAAWLIYRQREALAGVYPHTSMVGLLLLIPSVLVWALAALVEVQVVQQLALVSMLLAGTWAILGTEVVRLIAFPLCFVYLAVPMGEGLIPAMQELTATATVRMVELSGVPVYREGLIFSLPTGNWQVVEACSGVRYLIASFTLGVLYAYLSYSTRWKQLVFVVLSLVVPVVANALRAYLIVMLGHISEGRIAAGVDHLIYGWVFFGLVMLLLFWLGSLWSEESDVRSVNKAAPKSGSQNPWMLASAMIAAIALTGFGPLALSQIDNAEVVDNKQALTRVPYGDSSWEVFDASWPWQPLLAGADSVSERAYRNGEQEVLLTVQTHNGQQSAGGESIVGFKRLLGEQHSWHIVNVGHRTLSLKGGSMTVTEAQMNDGVQRLRVWYWFRIGPHFTGNPYIAKIFELLQRVKGTSVGTERLLLISAASPEQSAEVAMKRFVQQYPQLLGLSVDE